MSLKETYQKMCADAKALKYYAETGKRKGGKLFAFQNTNYRLLNSFIKNYRTFKKGADGIDRSLWELNSHHGQEKLKQHTKNMLKSRFFSKNERTYYSTKKGSILEKIPNSFNQEEKWVILYLLLIDGYFNDTPNYILRRTEEIYEDFLVYGNSETEITCMIKDFIEQAKLQEIEELFQHTYVYYDTFSKPFKEYDFLANYVNASLEDKKELHQYITSNYLASKGLVNNVVYQLDIFSKKYKTNGVYNKNMIVDNAKILYLSNYINKNTFRDFGEFIQKVVTEFAKIESINPEKIYQFIFHEAEDVFEMCYINLFNPDYFDNVVESSNSLSKEEEEKIIEQVPNTSLIENTEELTKRSSVLKKKAFERAEYKCELEDYCDCSSHYFTNKRTGKNYMELHHLIPREFSNDFEKSIEQIENYVSLCPRCHKFIHFAVDRERKNALHYLYIKRIESLRIKGIDIEEKQLRSYYKIKD